MANKPKKKIKQQPKDKKGPEAKFPKNKGKKKR